MLNVKKTGAHEECCVAAAKVGWSQREDVAVPKMLHGAQARLLR